MIKHKDFSYLKRINPTVAFVFSDNFHPKVSIHKT